MDTRIPLMVQSPDFAGSMMNGLNAGGMARQAQQQNALTSLYQSQGPQIMAGDPNALNALSRMDPMAAMGVQQNQLGMQGQRQSMAFDAERMQMVRNQAKEAAAAQAAALDAAAVQAEIAETQRTMAGAAPMFMAYKQGDQAAGQALMSYLARNGIQVTAETLEPTLYAMQGGLEGLNDGFATMKAQQDLMPKPVEVPKPTSSMQEYNFAVGQGFKGTFQEYEKSMKAAGAASTTVNMGGETTFDKQLGEADAATISGATSAGLAANRSLIQVNQLEQTLATAPQGATGFFVQAAGKLGIPMQGVDEVQAAAGLISALVPAQRPPGSGTMSDADLELFKQSLPQIMNQPGGNAKIIQTIKAIAEYDKAGGDIALRARLPEGDPMRLSRAEALRELQSRPNPLDGINLTNPSQSGQSAQPVVTNDADYDALPSGTTFTAPDGSTRIKP